MEKQKPVRELFQEIRQETNRFNKGGSNGDGKKWWDSGGTWLAQSVKHVTLDLGVVSWSPTLGGEIT